MNIGGVGRPHMIPWRNFRYTPPAENRCPSGLGVRIPPGSLPMSKKIEVHGKPHGFTSAHASSVSVVENDMAKCESVLVWRENGRAYLEFAFPASSTRVKRYLKESFWNDIVQEHYKHHRPSADQLVFEDVPFHIKGKGWIVQVDPKKNNCTHDELLLLKGHSVTLKGKVYKVKGAECMHGSCGYKGSVGLLLEDPNEVTVSGFNIGPKDLAQTVVHGDMRCPPGVTVTPLGTEPVAAVEPGYKTMVKVIEEFLKNPPKLPDDALIQKWRDTGLLRNVVKSGSYEEKVLVTLLENQKRQWVKENGL